MELDTIIIIIAIFATQITAIVYLSGRIDRLAERVSNMETRFSKVGAEMQSGFKELGIKIEHIEKRVDKIETDMRDQKIDFREFLEKLVASLKPPTIITT